MLTSCVRPKPNVLVVTADDMRYDHLPYMPHTLSAFAGGMEFTSCRQNVSLCQPARVGYLTGQFANRTGVYGNTQYMPDPSKSVGPWMQQGGYTTAMIGKYPVPFGGTKLNGWNVQRTFTAATEQNSHGYTVFDGTAGTQPPEYQTDYVFAQGRSFVTSAARPWFCWLAPTNPHIGLDLALEPRPEDLDDWLEVEWPVVHDDMVGKPSWMQALPELTDLSVLAIQAWAIGQLQELRSVDDGVASMFSTLQATGQLANTIVIFTSDNGVMYGEHRVAGFAPAAKNLPYDPSMRVPLLARGPGFTSGTSTTPVCGQDLTATCLAVARVTPTVPLDGLDLRSPPSSRVLLHERRGGPIGAMPNSVGVTTATRKLWRHEAGDPDRYEMYLLDTDPDELVNVAYDPAHLGERAALESELDARLATV
jgi:arylsulfatase A-like enzyme